MKFIRLTDSDQINVRNRTNNDEDYRRAIAHINNFYAIADENSKGLVRIKEGSLLSDPLLLNTKTKRFGTKEFNIPCKLTPKASSEAIENMIDTFNEAYLRRN